MYCPNCGAQNKDEAKFCSSCGASLGNTEGANGTGAETQAQAGSQDSDQNEAKEAGEAARHGFLSTTAGKVVLIIIIAAAAVVAVVGGRAAYRSSQAKTVIESAAEAAGIGDATISEVEIAEESVTETEDPEEVIEEPAGEPAGEEAAKKEAVGEEITDEEIIDEEIAEKPAEEEAAEEPEEAEIADDMYPELLEGGLTKEQFEIALAYAPEEMENGEISEEELVDIVANICLDFGDECFGGTIEDTMSGFRLCSCPLDRVNQFLSVLSDRPVSAGNSVADYVEISGDEVIVTLYDGEWMTPLADITDAVLEDDEITVTYNVRARGSGDYYPESTATRTAILKQTEDGSYRIDRIFVGTEEEPYEVQRQELLVSEENGYREEKIYYDLVSLEETDEANSAINESLNEDYQAFIAYDEQINGKPIEETISSDATYEYHSDGAGVTNIENGILSVKFKHTIMSDVDGTWYYGLTYSLETGEQLSITDLTDLSDEELLSGIRSALVNYINGTTFQNQSELVNKVNAYTLDDIGSGLDFTDSSTISFCVDDGEIVILVPPGEFFKDIWMNYEVPTGIYIPGAEPRADDTSSMASDGDYILPDSSTAYISESDIAGLTSEELRLARNEIYARHGRKFDNEGLQEYFNGKDWYNGTIEPDDFDDNSIFNEYEKENVKTIQDRENELNGTNISTNWDTNTTSSSSDTADAAAAGSIREIYEQVLKDVQNNKYNFTSASPDHYQYVVTDMNGDGIQDLFVAWEHFDDEGAGWTNLEEERVGRAFTVTPDGNEYALKVIDGTVDFVDAYFAGDGNNGLYVQKSFGRGTGNMSIALVTFASDTLSVGESVYYEPTDSGYGSFGSTDPDVTWYDASDLSGLNGVS